MTTSGINVELSRFRIAAERGYDLATEKYTKIVLTLQRAAQSVESSHSKQSKMAQLQNTALLSKQNEEIQELKEKISVIRENIESLKAQQKDFSIVVYGRAMAGKSTLMEILTRGDGKSIGKGTKRKKQEIREYYWNGLKLIDFPGFEFFNNDENDKSGMNAAKTADLVLFLLTNEEPQPEEAQCFAQLKSLGKPILCIVNIKKTLNFKKKDAAVKELQQIFSEDEEIQAVIENFKSFAPNYHQDWSDIKFFPTHLESAYLAHANKNPDEKLYEASHFQEVGDFIMDKVRRDGTFLRIKNYVDAVAVPTNAILMKIFEHAKNSFKECKLWTDSHKNVREWRHEFWGHANTKLYKIFENLQQNLNYEIQEFVEENYDAKDVAGKWRKHIQDFGYIARYQQILEYLAVKCEVELKELDAELTNELKYSLAGKTQTDIEIKGTMPWTQYIKINLPKLENFVSVSEFSANVTDNTNLKFGGFFSFFENKENKIRDAKDKLFKQLKDSSFAALTKVNNQAREILNRYMLVNIDEFSNVLANYALMLARLGKSQSEIAENLIGEYNELNSVLFEDAFSYKGVENVWGIRATMRIPGEMSIVIVDNTDINPHDISELLGERFFIMKPQKNWNENMKKVLHCDFKLDSYQLDFETDDKTHSVTPLEKVNPTRLKLAQQISPYPIMA